MNNYYFVTYQHYQLMSIFSENYLMLKLVLEDRKVKPGKKNREMKIVDKSLSKMK